MLLTERLIQPLVRLEPLPSSSTDSSWAVTTPSSRRPTSSQPTLPTRNLAFDGILSTTLPQLHPGEKVEHSVGVIFLASGSYSFRAAIEEVDLAVSSEALPHVHFSPLLHVDVAP